MSSFLCNMVGIIYPTYMSFKALESEAREDDAEWLMYWIIFGFFSFIETFADLICFWVPFYWTLKLLFLIALQMPQLKLCKTLYEEHVKPFLRKHEVLVDAKRAELIDRATASAKEMVNMGIDYVKTRGPEVLQKAKDFSSSPSTSSKAGAASSAATGGKKKSKKAD